MKPISRNPIAERRRLPRLSGGMMGRRIALRRTMRLHRGERHRDPADRHAAMPGVEPARLPESDLAVGRARSAGGPQDLASYTCGCGYCFSAPVSTTVACPHCGASQAW